MTSKLYVRSEGQDFRHPDYTLAREEDLRENPIVKKLVQEAYDRGYSTATRINESYKDYGKYTEMGDL